MIHTIIADDQQIVREGLQMILSLHDEISVVGEAANGKELLKLLETTVPDVILMDIRMPDMDGIEATGAVKKQWPQVKIIILTTFQEDAYVFRGLKNGADGYVFKDSGSDAIIESIHAALSGNMLLNAAITQKVLGALTTAPPSEQQHSALLEVLTAREIDVCQQILKGKSNREIGEALYVTEGTVKNYISHILSKLELKNRTELLLWLQNKK